MAQQQEASVSTLAGTGEYKHYDAKGLTATFKSIFGIALDTQRGQLYIADRDDNRLRAINLADGVTRTVAGTGDGEFKDGKGSEAAFDSPNGLAIDVPRGIVYVADQRNYRIRAYDVAKGTVSTVAGSGKPSFADGKVSAAGFSFPTGLALDQKNNILYATEQHAAVIRAINLNEGTVATIAGNATAGELRFADGKGVGAVFGAPAGLGLDTARGVLYVADKLNNRIRAIRLSDNTVTTIAGQAAAGFADGAGKDAQFDSPGGLAVDVEKGIVFVADNNNHRIRAIDVATGVVSTVAGSGCKGFADGPASKARLNFPKGLVFDSSKRLLHVTDQDNHRVRVVDLSPVATYVSKGSSSLLGVPSPVVGPANSKVSSVDAKDVAPISLGVAASKPTFSGSSLVSQLEALAALRRENLLTDAEFAAAKAKLLA